MLNILHKEHVGIVRMKAMARGSLWWYGIDRDVEYFGKSCEICQQVEARGSGIKPIQRPETSKPFERIHVDFFYFKAKQYFLLMDVYSKWLEVFILKKSTASEVI